MSLPERNVRRNQQSSRLAEANWLYTPDDVRSLYEICPNTLTNWIAAGLRFYADGRNRLFKGEDLNAFHKARRNAAKKSLGPFEAYCVACKRKHSLLDDPISVIWQTKTVSVSVRCPEKHTKAPRIMSIKRYEAMIALRGTNPRT